MWHLLLNFYLYLNTVDRKLFCFLFSDIPSHIAEVIIDVLYFFNNLVTFIINERYYTKFIINLKYNYYKNCKSLQD